MRLAYGLAYCVFLCCPIAAFPNCQPIDLSHPFEEGVTIYWPGAKPFELDEVFVGQNEKGYYYSSYNFAAADHGGTHIDAPVHFYEGKWTADQIPLTSLIGPACVVDITEQASSNRDYQLSKNDLQEWEKQNGQISPDCILIIRTGNEKFYPDQMGYMGGMTAEELHFPGIHPEAAEYIAYERPVKAVGLDTASLDYGQSKYFRTHTTLFEKNIVGIENLMNLDQLPARGAYFIGLPMKIKGGSGGPLRAMAYVNCPAIDNSSSSGKIVPFAILIIVLLSILSV